MPMNQMMQGPSAPVPVGDPRGRQMAEAVMRGADRQAPQPEQDAKMQAISVVRRMAEQDPSFLGELERMISEIRASESDMPRRGYTTRM